MTDDKAPFQGPGMVWTTNLPFFPSRELACKGSKEILLDSRFAAALPYLRLKFGRAMVLTSCCRSPAHNTKIGGHPRSLHLTVPFHPGAFGTMAADISWMAWPLALRADFVKLALSLGWSIGRARTFVHVDRRVDIGLAQAEYTYTGNQSPEEVSAASRRVCGGPLH